LIVAANAPDVDVLAYLGGPHFALAFRRGITHGWPAMLVLPFLVAGAFLWWDRRIRRRRDPSAPPAAPGALLLLAAVGVATHPLLDWMNTYGMRWGLPFDGSWSYGDTLFIIDPWIWLTLGGALFLTAERRGKAAVAWLPLAALTSLVVLAAPVQAAAKMLWLGTVVAIAVARRRHATPARSPRMSRGALALTVAYVAISALAFRTARGHVRAAADDAGLDVVDVLVAPLPATPFSADVQVRTPDGYVPGTHRWLDRPRVVLRSADLVPLTSGPATLSERHLRSILRDAGRVDEARHYLVWARYPYAVVSRADAGWRVRFSDVRYDDRGEAGSLAGVEVLVEGASGPPEDATGRTDGAPLSSAGTSATPAGVGG